MDYSPYNPPGPQLPDKATEFFHKWILKNLSTAADKTSEELLSDEEKSAMAIHAGAKWHIEKGRIKVSSPVGFIHQDGKWIVGVDGRFEHR